MMASANCVLFAVLYSALFAFCLAGPTSRILDGAEATTEGFPYIVSVRLDDAHVCGGCIIADNFILTAAHCVSELGITAVASSRVTVRAGSTNQYAGGKLYDIGAITIHPSYGSFLNDLAVLKTASNIDMGTRVQKIPLAESDDDIAPGSSVTVAGWGRTAPGGSNAYKLQYGDAAVLSTADCEESIGFGYASTLCLDSDPGKGSCNGDAGGPAERNGQLFGISNFVIGSCGTKYPDVFSKISYFKSWIDAIINVE